MKNLLSVFVFIIVIMSSCACKKETVTPEPVQKRTTYMDTCRVTFIQMVENRMPADSCGCKIIDLGWLPKMPPVPDSTSMF